MWLRYIALVGLGWCGLGVLSLLLFAVDCGGVALLFVWCSRVIWWCVWLVGLFGWVGIVVSLLYFLIVLFGP